MECNNCKERWRIILANQLNTQDMKDSKNAETENTLKEVVAEVKVPRKPDIDKIIEDRRKTVNEGKTINK